MGRIARGQLLYKGCYLHVYSRSLEKRKIFEEREDFESFKEKLSSVKNEYEFKIFHYCIMQTHFHLVVEVCNVESFPVGMKVLKKSVSQRYNLQKRRFGSVWRDRYGCKLIENEDYLYVCGKYVENNPVEAELVECAIDWPYSSSRHYELGEQDAVVDEYEIEAVNKNLSVDIKENYVKGWGSDWFQYNLNKQLKS